MSLVDRSNSLSRPNGEERIRDIFLGIPVDVLPQIHSRLELRTIIVQAGKQLTLPMQYEGVLEVRAGSLATGTENNRVVHRRGEMGQVSKGDRVTLQASGELAVLRAIYLVPGEK